ncbi:hypothetical protein [Halosimplex salinum]|uniref:hypothetical protein n=1 Tax=Halosimplex salinum TaxID=1710538 RepID=UPI000F494643|nr:hypothetical protein [Halosimplex salinum]
MTARSGEPAASPPDSKWAYVITFVPFSYLLGVLAAAYVVGSAVLGSGTVSFDDPVVVALVAVVSVLLFLGTISLPYALYRDISSSDPTDQSNWGVDRTTYVLTAAFGLFVPGLSAAVSLHYLYHRRTNARPA